MIWLLLLSGSGAFLWHYSTAPGAVGAPVSTAPSGLDVAGRYRLVMFLHPHCSCSRSSVSNLNHIVQTLPADSQVEVDLYFFRPENLPGDWHESRLWTDAQRIPQAVCHVDVGGQRATEFGVATSGHVLLFAPGGTRVFSGGITSGRGHDGENPGSETLSRLLSGLQSELADAPDSFAVYGCAIVNTADVENRKTPS